MPIYYSHNRAQSGRVIRRPCNARPARLCFYNWCIGSPIRMTKPPLRVRPSTRIPPCFWTRFDISPNRALPVPARSYSPFNSLDLGGGIEVRLKLSKIRDGCYHYSPLMRLLIVSILQLLFLLVCVCNFVFNIVVRYYSLILCLIMVYLSGRVLVRVNRRNFGRDKNIFSLFFNNNKYCKWIKKKYLSISIYQFDKSNSWGSINFWSKNME